MCHSSEVGVSSILRMTGWGKRWHWHLVLLSIELCRQTIQTHYRAPGRCLEFSLCHGPFTGNRPPPMPRPILLTIQTADLTLHALSHGYATNSPLVRMGCPTFAPQNYPLLWADSQTQPPLDPSDLPSQTVSISDQLFCHNALDRQTNKQTNRWLEEMFDDRSLPLYSEHQGILVGSIRYGTSSNFTFRGKVSELYGTLRWGWWNGTTMLPNSSILWNLTSVVACWLWTFLTRGTPLLNLDHVMSIFI